MKEKEAVESIQRQEACTQWVQEQIILEKRLEAQRATEKRRAMTSESDRASKEGTHTRQLRRETSEDSDDGNHKWQPRKDESSRKLTIKLKQIAAKLSTADCRSVKYQYMGKRTGMKKPREESS